MAAADSATTTPTTVLTESDVDAFGGAQIASAVLRGTAGNRCQTDACIRIKILTTLRYRTHGLWQAFLLDRYLAAVAAAAADPKPGGRTGAVVVDYACLVQWSAPTRWLYTGGPVASGGGGVGAPPPPPDALRVVRVELLVPAGGGVLEYLSAVAVYRGGGLVVLPFSAAARAAARTVPWESLFGGDGRPPLRVKIQQAERPWVSLLWLHACLARGGGCDAVRTLGQDFATERSTAIFEFHVCDELVPPLRRARDMERRFLVPFDRDRRRRLETLPPLREIIGKVIQAEAVVTGGSSPPCEGAYCPQASG